MIFTHLARGVAILAVFLGGFQIAMGFAIAESLILPYAEALARYAPGAKNAGDVINRGPYAVGFGLAIGVLTDISYGVRRQSSSN